MQVPSERGGPGTHGLRFRLGLDNTIVVQQGTNGPGDRTGASGELNLFGKGRLIGTSDQDYAGYLGFKGRYRYQIGSQTPNDLDSQIGTLWSTTDGFGELTPSLIQLWWEQHLFENALVVTAGKLDANNFYNNYRFADDNNFFFNRAFSSNPARNHPDNGLGVNFLFKPVAPFYVSTGFQDAQGQATTTGFSTFGEGDYFYGVEVGMAPKMQGYGQGNYRLTFEYTDPIDWFGLT
jgi:carbohydrate-selective porin OprB